MSHNMLSSLLLLRRKLNKKETNQRNIFSLDVITDNLNAKIPENTFGLGCLASSKIVAGYNKLFAILFEQLEN